MATELWQSPLAGGSPVQQQQVAQANDITCPTCRSSSSFFSLMRRSSRRLTRSASSDSSRPHRDGLVTHNTAHRFKLDTYGHMHTVLNGIILTTTLNTNR